MTKKKGGSLAGPPSLCFTGVCDPVFRSLLLADTVQLTLVSNGIESAILTLVHVAEALLLVFQQTLLADDAVVFVGSELVHSG